MKRIGKFTGRIYDEHYDFNKIKECCKEVSDETASNPTLVEFIYFTEHENCEGCYKCSAARKTLRKLRRRK